MNLPHTRFIQSRNCKATESIQKENCKQLFFKIINKKKKNYVDRFGTVSVRNVHYLSDIYQNNPVFNKA